MRERERERERERTIKAKNERVTTSLITLSRSPPVLLLRLNETASYCILNSRILHSILNI